MHEDYLTDFKCPYCAYKYEIGKDELYDMVSYWGDQDIHELQCYECDQIFYVDEVVHRSFEVGKTREEIEI